MGNQNVQSLNHNNDLFKKTFLAFPALRNNKNYFFLVIFMLSFRS